DARVGGIDAAALRHLFRELGFNRHLNDLNRLLEESRSAGEKGQTTSGEAGEADEPFPTSLFDAGTDGRGSDTRIAADLTRANAEDYRAILTRPQLDELVDTLRQQPLISVDTETVGLGHRQQL